MNGEKHEDPNDFLDRLIASVPGILAAMIVSTEGVPIASKPIVLMNQEHVPAMIAVMQSLGKKATLAWQAGDLEQVFVRGKNGYFVVKRWGSDMILAISATADMKIGYILDDLYA